MICTPSASHPHGFPDKPVEQSLLNYYSQTPFDSYSLPEEVVDLVLQTLQNAGIEVVEWGALLLRRMGVPRLVRDYSYAVPDEDIIAASRSLEALGLPLSPPSDFMLKVESDMVARGHFYRISHFTAPSSIQRLVLYPLSFASIQFPELSKAPPLHLSPSRCLDVLVPRPSAVFASIMRIMLCYPQYCRMRTMLEADMSELIMYHLLGYTLEDADGDDEDQSEDDNRRVTAAVQVIRNWGIKREWAEDEEWMGDALASIVTGDGHVRYLPSQS
ncbi:uncharacterized protein FIBRA_02076 [Fibroporia radiculosa]|uniref:Uncharacterized protein n=1 Tax=Fibroporia radiculosa TaxID=599839 RepID=J4GMB3_9APHY|nr:uncharacterized protein FIBRA_02076 [Fibroporia radiculosa]CCM00050.1 predicted protein [Fibroporia radiculosa]